MTASITSTYVEIVLRVFVLIIINVSLIPSNKRFDAICAEISETHIQ